MSYCVPECRWSAVRKAVPRWLDDCARAAPRSSPRWASRPTRDEEWRFTNTAALAAIDVRSGRADLRRRRASRRLCLRRRAAAPGVRQRPLRHDAVAHHGTAARRARRLARHRAQGESRRRPALSRPAGGFHDTQLHGAQHRVPAGRRVHPRAGRRRARGADPRHLRVGRRRVEDDVAPAHADRRRGRRPGAGHRELHRRARVRPTSPTR